MSSKEYDIMSKFDDLLAILPDTSRQLIKAADIRTLDDMVSAVKTASLRSDFARKHDLTPSKINELATKADLLRIDGVDMNIAEQLMNVGVNSSSDLIENDVGSLLYRLKNRYPDDRVLYSANDINKLIANAKVLSTSIDPDIDDKGMGILSTQKPENKDVFFSEMTDLIVDLGRSIAEAQRVMDENTIRTQEMINDDEELRQYGINATWYVIPEADINLKMNYTVINESTTTGTGQRKIMISPINARYQNFFKSTQSGESTINLKIMPIPAEARIADIIIIPNVIGMNKVAAVNRLSEVNLRADGVDEISNDAVVQNQKPSSGDTARFNDTVLLMFDL